MTPKDQLGLSAIDKPPSIGAVLCRRFFKELDLRLQTTNSLLTNNNSTINKWELSLGSFASFYGLTVISNQNKFYFYFILFFFVVIYKRCKITKYFVNRLKSKSCLKIAFNLLLKFLNFINCLTKNNLNFVIKCSLYLTIKTFESLVIKLIKSYDLVLKQDLKWVQIWPFLQSFDPKIFNKIGTN